MVFPRNLECEVDNGFAAVGVEGGKYIKRGSSPEFEQSMYRGESTLHQESQSSFLRGPEADIL